MALFDYVILFVILVWLIAAVYYIIKRKKSGQHACGGQCAGCPHRCQ